MLMLTADKVRADCGITVEKIKPAYQTKCVHKKRLLGGRTDIKVKNALYLLYFTFIVFHFFIFHSFVFLVTRYYMSVNHPVLARIPHW